MNDKSILKDKNCFITGATGGLGKKIAELFAASGCNLFLTGRKQDELKAIESELKANTALTCEIHTTICDLNNIDELKNTAQLAIDTYSNIDILVNCAGVFMVEPLSESTESDYSQIFNVNIRASIFFSKIFSEGMKENKWGRIINIGSSSSIKGIKNTTLYCASKHALLGFSRALHDELKIHNIRTFCFMPGSIKTEMGNMVPDQSFDTFLDPIEVAEYILYAISFDNELFSGEISFERMNMS